MTVIEDRIYTVDDLWTISHARWDDPKRYDLIDGKLYEAPLAGGIAGVLTAELSFRMDMVVREHHLGWMTAPETGYTLNKEADGRDTVLGPDISFVTEARMPAKLPDSYIPFAPDLAIEVVAPDISADEMSVKLVAYLRYGTREVWLVYPNKQEIHIYRASGEVGSATVEFLTREDTLNGGDLLPGFTLSLGDFFASQR